MFDNHLILDSEILFLVLSISFLFCYVPFTNGFQNPRQVLKTNKSRETNVRTFGSVRFKAIKGGNIVRTPGLQFPDGLHVQIMEK